MSVRVTYTHFDEQHVEHHKSFLCHQPTACANFRALRALGLEIVSMFVDNGVDVLYSIQNETLGVFKQHATSWTDVFGHPLETMLKSFNHDELVFWLSFQQADEVSP